MLRFSFREFLIYFFLFIVLNSLLVVCLGFVFSFHEELNNQGLIFIVIESILIFLNFVGSIFTQNQDSIFLNYFLSIIILSVLFSLITTLVIKFFKNNHF